MKCLCLAVCLLLSAAALLSQAHIDSLEYTLLAPDDGGHLDIEAIDSFRVFREMPDSPLSEDIAVRIAEIEAKYGSEAMRREIDALEHTREKQNIQRAILIVIMLTLAGIVLLQWSLNRHRFQLNKLLTVKNEQIEAQKLELELTLERLKTSYAERQDAHEAILKLERKNSALAMAVTANHEINQPLMLISGNLDLLDMNPDKEKHDMYIERMRAAIAQIKSILRKFNSLREVQFTQYSKTTDMVDISEVPEDTDDLDA